MNYIKSIISLIISFIMSIFSFSCFEPSEPVKAEDFRITAYVVANTLRSGFDESNLSRVTDVIYFGGATFNEQGEIVLDEAFESDVEYLKSVLDGQNLYLNLLGPASQSDSEDYSERMHDLADRHTRAFRSGRLENEILSCLEKYDFDGVFFDYEYPLRVTDWTAYNIFIVGLDSVLGEDYKIGLALSSWALGQSPAAKSVTDFVEIMCYDLWDEQGNHATMEFVQNDIKKFIKAGYDPQKLDMGVPFYARPTTHEEYWYSYRGYADVIDENGLYLDPVTGLTFSFNTYDLVYEKTEAAIDAGLGGMMVWHYACDLPADDSRSLFGAIYDAKQAAILAAE